VLFLPWSFRVLLKMLADYAAVELGYTSHNAYDWDCTDRMGEN
jgi:hypothetical protein